MDLFNIKNEESILAVCDTPDNEQIEQYVKSIPKKTIILPEKLTELQDANDVVLVNLPERKLTDTLLQQVMKCLKPGAKLLILNVTKDLDNLEFLLKITGFTNVEVRDTNIISSRPKYEIGSSAKLNLKKTPPTVWKIDDDLNEDETIDPDNLLDDDDLKKPDPSSLRVCGTTGKRKACKDCSCGLAEELANEATAGRPVVDATNAPRSSCGNCYLGDAFRCASCPYLGMPAFKPGEKIQLKDSLLKADI